ncbi:hypothetical protein BDW02DRAFT_264834 [Decorospora gaudefroyi]|uniref:MYND-type domain-containing protein n=1 Tax=Decorospora gaudefroyi TaxID=184978 RepID=A0A6A5KK22_9PLEO|nr:hypothetical protein BDW02DRAFT_264834 [Decorospora gaudefroyi]
MAAEYLQMLQNTPTRPLEDLQNTDDQLAGANGLVLKGWAYKSPTVPTRDFTDPFGQTLLAAYRGSFDAPKNYAETMIAGLGGTDEARATVRKDVYKKRWGPTRQPIYAVLLPALHMLPGKQAELLGLTRYLAHELQVPVDGKDVLGCTALYWSISTKPYAQPAFAQLLFDVGASVNAKNRLGTTAGFEIAQVDIEGGSADTTVNVRMMQWYVRHGGDVEGKDPDGISVRALVQMLEGKVPGLAMVLRQGRGERESGDCTNCGRKPPVEGARFAACAKCKGVRYCGQECQKVDWKAHKRVCVAV